MQARVREHHSRHRTPTFTSTLRFLPDASTMGAKQKRSGSGRSTLEVEMIMNRGFLATTRFDRKWKVKVA
jgi:hypothetical protein